ncbi:MAG TPA: IS3 family transposase [Acidobacteriota bacterium]|nr:IS3 family transposase [Acidobacteriota bacterium]
MKDLQQFGLSERRGCALAGVARSYARYERRRREDEALIRELKAIAFQQPRCGYRMAWARLRRSGVIVNRKKVLRLWRLAGLTQKRRRSRVRRKGHRVEGPLQAAYPRHVVTYDFMFDATAQGARLKILTVVDEFTREALAIAVGHRMTARDVIWVLAKAFKAGGWPEFIRSDNGPEFIAEALEAWLKDRGVTTHHIDPGSPWQNAYGESFNSRLRAECLELEVFETKEEARKVLEAWRRQYNQERPHSSLGYRTPTEAISAWRGKAKEPFLLPAPRALRAPRGGGGQKERLFSRVGQTPKG